MNLNKTSKARQQLETQDHSQIHTQTSFTPLSGEKSAAKSVNYFKLEQIKKVNEFSKDVNALKIQQK